MTEARKIQKKIDGLYDKLTQLSNTFPPSEEIELERSKIQKEINELTAKLEALNNSMQEIFMHMIMRLFTVDPYYVDNWMDSYHGFEFNPDPRVMIQLMMSFPKREDPAGAYIMIQRHTMRFYPNKLETKQIYSGQTILLESGDCDYEFYEKILKNWRAF
jgi:hypothetical protein